MTTEFSIEPAPERFGVWLTAITVALTTAAVSPDAMNVRSDIVSPPCLLLVNWFWPQAWRGVLL